MKLLNSNNTREGGRLEQLLRAGREPGGQRLSASARSTILNESLKPEATEGLPALFTPTRHILVAGALPVILAVALLVGGNPGLQTPIDTAVPTTRVAVSKVDGRLQFDIGNGGKAHTVYRTTDPRDLTTGRAVQVNGEYEEGLHDQADLVFYRID